MMDTQKAYDQWSSTYDSIANKSRDLELVAGKEMLTVADFTKVLEIGCGTGKNTSWLVDKTKDLLAVDFSEGMLAVATRKINSAHVNFQQADITKQWNFKKVSLIVCSLVLEHIENIDFIFEQASKTLDDNGCFYICELHPYKQLEGSRAKFEQGNELVELEYFIHHITDFFSAALKNGMHCIGLKEWFDGNDKTTTPRLVSFLFQKKL
jgi:ubiquinone/menaquinone biosynthesis C-methylase UbiE